jgi:hypothetical protein
MKPTSIVAAHAMLAAQHPAKLETEEPLALTHFLPAIRLVPVTGNPNQDVSAVNKQRNMLQNARLHSGGAYAAMGGSRKRL